MQAYLLVFVGAGLGDSLPALVCFVGSVLLGAPSQWAGRAPMRSFT
jgi:hypothetical protein